MKGSLLICALLLSWQTWAQDLSKLPAGRYETTIRNSNSRWDLGDLLIIDDQHYKVSNSNETGEYRFSAAAQRVFFTSGPLKGAFAKTLQVANAPAIILPLTENQQVGIRMAPSDLVCRLNQ